MPYAESTVFIEIVKQSCRVRKSDHDKNFLYLYIHINEKSSGYIQWIWLPPWDEAGCGIISEE